MLENILPGREWDPGCQDLWLRVLRDPGGLTPASSIAGPTGAASLQVMFRCFIQGTHVTCFKQSLLHMLSDTKELHVFGAKNVPLVSS